MLKKANRLSRVRLSKTAKTFSSPFLTVKIAETKENTKFAFVISKRVDKRATVRNKLKRTLSKAIEKDLQNINQGQSVVIIAKFEILQKDPEEQEKLLIELFKKADLIK